MILPTQEFVKIARRAAKSDDALDFALQYLHSFPKAESVDIARIQLLIDAASEDDASLKKSIQGYALRIARKGYPQQADYLLYLAVRGLLSKPRLLMLLVHFDAEI